ncbi:MAG: deoxyguanosinetriphosphate triphosphohydrolase, partial [Parvularculaceae bacterium]
TADAVRGHSAPVVAFSESMAAQVQQLRDFLWQRMYRHYKVNRARSHARRIVRELFELFFQEPDTLPPMWRSKFGDNKDEARKARAVCDYIAGMTDRYAITEHQKLFGAANWL